MAKVALSNSVLEMTGARTKIVWVHGVIGKGRARGWDGTEPEYELKAFDTAEGTPRVLLPGPACYANPCISPDGTAVFYSDARSNTICRLNWDGSDQREFGKGYVLCAWRNPADGSQWLYFTDQGYMKGQVVRCRIDDPAVRETVWERDQAAHTLSVSADGTHAGSEFPWPLAGVAVLPNVSWKQYGSGCNACIAPDNSYRFLHMGEEASHGGVIFYDDGGANRRVILFDNVPGRPRSDSWVPRWTNDVRFLTLNCPIGDDGADIYLGQFSDSFTRVEKWVQITDQPGQDTKACGWIEPGLGHHAGEVPLTVAIPQWITPGDGWQWDYGDAASESRAGSHTYAKPGSYVITARRGGTALRGWVQARPRGQPSAVAVSLFDESHVQVAFDERVQLRDPELSLKSGVPVRSAALDGEGFRLLLEIDGVLNKKDVLNLRGVFDRAQQPNAAAGSAEIVRPEWPANRAGLAFCWEGARSPSFGRRQNFHWNPSSRVFEENSLITHGLARTNRDGALDLNGGTCSITDGGAGIAEQCRTAGRFTVQAVIAPANIYQGNRSTPARIFACGRDMHFGNCNLVLAQEGGLLVLYLQTRPGDRDELQRAELCPITDCSPHHVAAVFAEGSVACYVDGKLARTAANIPGKLNWQKPDFATGLHLGGLPGTEFPWRGAIECIAVSSAALTAQDIAADSAACLKAIAKRKPLPRLRIEAKLSEKSRIPSPADVAPYRDALVVNEFDVTRVVSGKYKPSSIRVAQWGMLDAQPTRVADAKRGDLADLILERLADHPELEAEAIRDTLDENFDLELYVDVTPSPSGAPRLARITVRPAEIWLPLNASQQYFTEQIDQYGNPIDARIAWSAAPGGQIDTGTAYGAGNWFDERKLQGEAKIDAAGLLASTGKPGVVTVTAAAPDQPDVRGTAIVCIGDWPSINPASRAILRIGADNSYGKGFAGDIDRIRICNRALPPDELARHAAGTGLGTADGLVADWTFDELADGVYRNTAASVAAGAGLTAKPLHLDPGKTVQQLNEDGRRFIRLDGRAYLDVEPDPRLDFCRRATVEAWIRTAGSRAIQGGTIVSKQIVWMWGFVFNAESGRLGCDALRTDTGWLDAPFSFSADTWTHVAAVFDVNGRWLLYANGKLVGETKPHALSIR